MSCRNDLKMNCGITAYMVQKLGIDIHEVPALCTRLYKTYGTSMAGLWAEGRRFDQDDFHRFVHGRLPYELLRPDPFLRNLILSMPQRKFVSHPTSLSPN
jgi:hypothetical protein